MDIAYIANVRIPHVKANAYQISQMCQAFRERGASVTLYLPRRWNPLGRPSKDSIARYHALRAPPDVRVLPTLDPLGWCERWGIGSDGSVAERAAFLAQTAAMGLATAAVVGGARNGGTPTCYTRDFGIAFLLSKLLPKPRRIVVEAHSLSAAPERRRIQARLFNRLGGVVAVTATMRRHLIEAGMDARRVVAAPDAVDLATFDIGLERAAARARLGLPDRGRIVAFIGRFNTLGEEKGLPEMLAAARGVLARHPEVRFYFVGGPLDQLARYRDALALFGDARDRVVFLDKQPVEDVPAYLKASDILLMTHPPGHFYENYVSPLKLFEYMAAGRPIIGSRLPAIMEILRHEDNALLVRPGDASELEQAIERLLSDQGLAHRIAAQAHGDVQRHSWTSRAADILAFIDGLAERSDRP